MTNLKMIDNTPLVGTKEFHIVKRGSFTVGIICIAEVEWVASLAEFDEDDIVYEDMVKSATKWAKILSKEIFF